MVCRVTVVLGGGVPLAGPQEELRDPSGYTPRGFEGRVFIENDHSGDIYSGRRSKKFRVYNNKKTKK